jgi:ectoine hydroxylase-related dioxygenase (phytanoyl-CoA dioxygenase family)
MLNNLSFHHAKYNKNGFTIVRNLFSKSNIKNLMSELEEIKIKVERTKNNQFFHKTVDGKFNTIHNIQRYHKKGLINDLAKNNFLNKLIKKILNDTPVIRNIEFFLKPKKTGMASPFHQDNFYWNIISANALNVWIACSEANKRNGGLCYLEESHKLGTINHTISFAKGSSQKIPKKIINKLQFTKKYPSLEPGDCLIHHPEVIHGSKKNTSNKDRIGFVLSYRGRKSNIDKLRLSLYKKSLQKNLREIYS